MGETVELPASDRIPMSREAPAVVGRFELGRRLGEGGMGEVYEGHDRDLGRKVALKLVRGGASDDAYTGRLFREAAAMARVEHPNVVRVFDVGRAGDRVFVAMELVEGVTLRAWLEESRTRREILAVFEQAAAGLVAVHRCGLVHRDFKPDNVLIDHAGRARVGDFGLARLDPGSECGAPALAATLTRTGAVVGTPGYMPPEQQIGGEVDARADQYAYCVALREALTGGRSQRPGAGGARRLPARLHAVLARGLAYDPGDRFASMEELVAALRRARRPRFALAVAAVSFILVLAAAGAIALAFGGSTGIAGGPGATTAIVAARDAGSRGAPLPPAGDAAPAPADRDGDRHAAVRPAPAPALAPARTHVAVPAPLPPAGPRKLASGEHVQMLPPKGSSGRPIESIVHEMDRAHLPAVAAAVHDLGYAGGALHHADPTADRAKLNDRLAAAETDDHALRLRLETELGLLERERGDCGAAVRAFQAADAALHEVTLDHETERAAGRAHAGLALCMLEAGHAVAARSWLSSAGYFLRTGGAAQREVAEVALVSAITMYETGSPDLGAEDVAAVRAAGNDTLVALLATWAKAVGVVLP